MRAARPSAPRRRSGSPYSCRHREANGDGKPGDPPRRQEDESWGSDEPSLHIPHESGVQPGPPTPCPRPARGLEASARCVPAPQPSPQDQPFPGWPRSRAQPRRLGSTSPASRSPPGAGADTSQISEHGAGGWRGLALAERRGEQLAAGSLPLRAPAGVRSLTFPASVPLLHFSLSPPFFFFLFP